MSSYLRVLRHPDFKYLFLGQAASVIGDRVVVVAIALFVTQSTGSATDLGLILASQALPLVGLLLFGGVWADRLPRHRIMIVTDVTRAALHTMLAILIFTGAVRVWQLAAIEAAFGAAQAFFQPAYTGLIPQTVPESLIQEARALTQSIENVAFLVGPALATALVLGVGAGEAFVFDAATFVLSALLLMRVQPRRREGGLAGARGEAATRGEAGARGEAGVRGSGGLRALAPEETAPPAAVFQELRAGFGEVRSRTWVWVTIAAFTGAVLCVYAPWYSLAPIIARDAYAGAGVFGVLESVAGVGAVVGAVVALSWRPARPLRTGLVLVLAWPIEAAMFALKAPLPIVIVLSLASGFGWSLLMILWETALAQYIPPRALSRVSAYDWMGSLALLPLGYLLAGPLASVFGPRPVLGVGSAIGVVLLLLALAPRSTRALGQDAGEPGHGGQRR